MKEKFKYMKTDDGKILFRITNSSSSYEFRNPSKMGKTTKSFLDYFNLKKLSELPELEDIKDFDSINPDLFEVLEKEMNLDSKKTDNNLTSTISSDNIMETEDVDDEITESAKVIPFSN